jgi:Rrf2 family transcriptional regulator, iron-sulfur cluster assembly transcription factor
MVFTKSFGYSVRSILYLATLKEKKDKVSLDEIAAQLDVPRHFLGKVLKRLVKAGILDSRRGPTGGFQLNETTLQTTLLRVAELTGENEQFQMCVFRLHHCDPRNPCAMHQDAEGLKNEWFRVLSNKTINDLVKKG